MKVFGHVGNKKFRYYKDKHMSQLSGAFNFDRVNCLIMIDDGDENGHSSTFIEPTNFKIHIIGLQKEFIFNTASSMTLRSWTNALYNNWNASKSCKIANSPSFLHSKFWKVRNHSKFKLL